MPSILTPKQIAFDIAVKSWCDALYTGIVDLEALRATDTALGPKVRELILLRETFNAALAVEGQHIIGDAPHAPFYLDYLEARTSNARAFADAEHSFIGLTLPLIDDVGAIANPDSPREGSLRGARREAQVAKGSALANKAITV